MEPSTLGSGRYTVKGVLGEGAQGKTFDAVDAQGKAVAIKRFDVRGAKGWKDVELAEREARVLSTIDHPLVPRYIEHFEDDGALYLVMEKVEGETLDAIRKREGALAEDEVRRFLADADRALTYLHGRASPIVHRDIKPKNVVRRPNGTYVIVDFGAVSELIHRREGASTVVGTLGFMAPEQFQGRALPSTDIYAVGATALSALAGADPDQLPHQGLKVDVRAALGERVSPTMVSALESMLEPDPDRRAQSLGGALDAVRSQSSSYRPPPMVTGPPPPPANWGMPAMPPVPAPHPAAIYQPPADPVEAATLKSARRLLWVLWGIGWALVPMILGPAGLGRYIAPIMFSALAAIIVLNWNRGMLLGAMMRKIGLLRSPTPPHAQMPSAPPPASGAQGSVHHRIDVGPSAQVRVHTTEVRPDELGQTERTSTRTRAAQQARRP